MESLKRLDLSRFIYFFHSICNVSKLKLNIIIEWNKLLNYFLHFKTTCIPFHYCFIPSNQTYPQWKNDMLVMIQKDPSNSKLKVTKVQFIFMLNNLRLPCSLLVGFYLQYTFPLMGSRIVICRQQNMLATECFLPFTCQGIIILSTTLFGFYSLHMLSLLGLWLHNSSQYKTLVNKLECHVIICIGVCETLEVSCF